MAQRVETEWSLMSYGGFWHIEQNCQRPLGEEAKDNDAWDIYLRGVADNLLDRFAYLTGDRNGTVIDTFTGQILTWSTFAGGYARFARGIRNPDTGNIMQVRATDLWKTDMRRSDITGFAFRPGHTDALVNISQEGFKLNLWRPPVFNYKPTEDDKDWSWHLFFDVFLKGHLAKTQIDYEEIENWIRCLVCHPEARGVALVMMTASQGTGRGVLFKILRRLVGEKWCKQTNFDNLIGKGAGSRFGDRFVNNVVTMVGEAKDGGYDKSAAYEHLKDTHDTFPQPMEIEPKGKAAYTDLVASSLMIATNEVMRPLPIEANDRRFNFVDITDQPLVLNKKAKEFVDFVMPQPKTKKSAEQSEKFFASLYAAILEDGVEKIEFDRFVRAPDTPARDRVIGAIGGEYEDALREALENVDRDRHALSFAPLVKDIENGLMRRKKSAKGLKNRLAKMLSRDVVTGQDGTRQRGFGGWYLVSEDRAEFKLNDGTRANTSVKGITTKTGRNGETRYFMRGMVVRLDACDPDDLYQRGAAVATLPVPNLVSPEARKKQIRAVT